MNATKVLIVEDEAILALEIERELGMLGYGVTAAVSSAAAAINSIKTQRPDIVLMDIGLKGDRDGIQTAADIFTTWAIPVVLMTSGSDKQTLHRAREAMAYGYINKPIRSHDLRTNIELGLFKHREQHERVRHQGFIESILNQVQEGVCLFDRELGLIFANNPARRLLALEQLPTSTDAKPYAAAAMLKLRDAATLRPIPIAEVFAPLPPSLPRIFDDLLLERHDGELLNIAVRVSQIAGLGAEGAEGEESAETPKSIDAVLNLGDGAATASLSAGGAKQPAATASNAAAVSSAWMLSFLDISTQQHLAHSIEYQAKHDTLTQLPTREIFLKMFSKILTNSETRQHHALAILNLDKFRLLNEIWGQLVGDEQLRKVARDLEEQSSVVGISRIANDEFALLLNIAKCSLEEELEELRKKCERKLETGTDVFPLSASIGAIRLDGTDGEVHDAAMLLSSAREACAQSKARGGNAWLVGQPNRALTEAHRGEMYWLNQLMGALDEQRFLLYFQRIQGLRDSLGPKIEILLRLKNSAGDIVSPGQFLGTAERYRLMSRIDLFVLQETISYLSSVPKTAELGINVNLSGSTLQDQAALDKILQLLSQHPEAASRLCLEITETSAIQHFDRVVEFMRQAIALGVHFALDDFGNGFSSFAYLKKLPVSSLKIDGSFVRDVTHSRTSRAMVAAINKLGHELGLSTVAEFVSNNEILAEVRNLGVDYAQGYVIQEPEPLA